MKKTETIETVAQTAVLFRAALPKTQKEERVCSVCRWTAFEARIHCRKSLSASDCLLAGGGSECVTSGLKASPAL